MIARARPNWQLSLYHRGRLNENPFEEFCNVIAQRIDCVGDRWRLWEQVRLPAAAWRDRAQLLHCPANSCPRFSRVPVVSTVHDLIPLKVEEQKDQASNFRKRVERCLEKSARIITVSESTKRDLISDFGANSDRIDVITWAPDAAYAPVRDEVALAAVRARYNIRDRYILAFSGRSRRKNALGMIAGFGQIAAVLRREVQFVVVGVEPEAQRDRCREVLRRLGLDQQCVVWGFVPERDVPPLLSGAELMAFCSLYEGFGLPILDAFCCETPVLTSDVSSMPEVAGDAAVYCDPKQPDSIAAGMTRLLEDAALRKELVCKGRERVQRFNWNNTAESICRIFEKCL